MGLSGFIGREINAFLGKSESFAGQKTKSKIQRTNFTNEETFFLECGQTAFYCIALNKRSHKILKS